MSPRTKDTYLGWIRRYLEHYGRCHPASLGRVDIERYLEHLARARHLSADSLNLAASSIAFMYRELWGIEVGGRNGVRRAKSPSRLPRTASREEVDRVLEQLRGPVKVAAMLMYGSGARVSEVVAIRIKDLDLANHELTIRNGKGARDRVTVLPRGALEALRVLMRLAEHQHRKDVEHGGGWAPLPGALHRKDPRAGWELGWQFLFPSTKPSFDRKTGRPGRSAIHVTTIQRAIKRAVHRAGVAKPISCHTLRHCFATELIRGGCDIRMLQRLMGHTNLRTTAQYLHIVERPGVAVESPFDRLPSERGRRG